MAKQDYILRYLSIIKKLRRAGEATFPEIREYLEKESEFQDRPFSISNRTFLRDLNEIRQIFRVDIRYDFHRGVYFIEEDQQRDMNNRMLESVDTINSLKMVSDIAGYMSFEKRRASGTHHFHGLIHAIKNRVVIRLTHQRFDDDEPRDREVEPYALKESKGRWYLLAKDRNDRKIKTFGLDRIVDFQTMAARFDFPPGLDINEIFRYSFGVINVDDQQPAEIVLSFKPEQGKYIKSYPLHESQAVVTDDSEELRIRLTLFVTIDLVMEILSYGKSVKVISPPLLVERVKNTLAEALSLYK